jgi:hypothetical protein
MTMVVADKSDDEDGTVNKSSAECKSNSIGVPINMVGYESLLMAKVYSVETSRLKICRGCIYHAVDIRFGLDCGPHEY